MLNILEYLTKNNIEVVRDDGDELACLCPFHNNTDSPAFYINKHTGLWICFNPSCEKRGSIRDLMAFFGDHRKIVEDHSYDEIQKLLMNYEEIKYEENWSDALSGIKIHFPDEEGRADYLLARGFDQQTLEYFEVGFSKKRNRLVIPARNESSKLVGFIGRAVDEITQPKYLYSKGFPRKFILFNLNHAKRFDSVIVVEGSLDAMMIHQAGFPNVVATLGAAVTDHHVFLLKKYFDEIIVFSDNDHAGFAMRDIIVGNITDKCVKTVTYPSANAKDPGDLTAEQISECVSGAEDWLLASLGGETPSGVV